MDENLFDEEYGFLSPEEAQLMDILLRATRFACRKDVQLHSIDFRTAEITVLLPDKTQVEFDFTVVQKGNDHRVTLISHTQGYFELLVTDTTISNI